MRVQSVVFRGFKRFTETTIGNLPASARLVVLAGPNGSGKSSIFDGFRTWHAVQGAGGGWDEAYGHKVGTPDLSWPERVTLSMHDGVPAGDDDKKRMIYIRSAFRNEADFAVNNFSRLGSPLDTVRIARLIDNDVSVSENYQRLIMQTIDGIYDSSVPDTATKAQIRDRIIGEVQRSMVKVFPDLMLTGVGGIGSSADAVGTFYFDKGGSTGFLFKNLSAGEKAAFDLLLDVVIKREFYSDTVWCIDEPETHLNTRVQALLLQALIDLLPDACQLWIASHSIGFMRKSWEIAKERPGEVAFLDLQGHDFDQPVVLSPVSPTRDFWARALDVALGDLALLVAPEHVVLCEGRPPKGTRDHKAEFDAACYRTIFAKEQPETDFISVGNSDDSGKDRLELGRAIQALAAGTKVTRLIDRDMRTIEEVEEQKAAGVQVLGRRHLESYLLDDEVIGKLCVVQGQPNKIDEALKAKRDEMEAAVRDRGKDVDDVKSAAGSIYVALRRLLMLSGAGQTWEGFAKFTLAPLITSDMAIYAELRQSIFGD